MEAALYVLFVQCFDTYLVSIHSQACLGRFCAAAMHTDDTLSSCWYSAETFVLKASTYAQLGDYDCRMGFQLHYCITEEDNPHYRYRVAPHSLEHRAACGSLASSPCHGHVHGGRHSYEIRMNHAV